MKKILIGLTLLASMSSFASGVKLSKEFLNQTRIDVLKLGSDLFLDNTSNEVKITHVQITKIGSSDIIIYRFEYDKECKTMGYDIQLDSAVYFEKQNCYL